MKRKTGYILVLFSFISFAIHSQFYQPFSQGQSLPLYQNPSFAGTLVYPRFTIGGVMNSSDASAFTVLGVSRFYCSYDQYLPVIKSGIGIMYTSNPDIYSPFKTQRVQGEISCSPKIKLKNKFTLSLGGSIGFSSILADQNDVKQYSNQSYSSQPSLSYSVGVILHSPTFYVGYSLRRFPSLKAEYFGVDPFFSYNLILRDKFVSTAQIAYVFRKKKSDKITFSPALLLQFYHMDNGFIQADYQVNFSLKRNFFFWGAGFSSNSRFMMIGFHGEKIRLAYSASLINQSGNPFVVAQEMVFSYTFIR
jgi:hypothetical protein